MGGRDKSGLGPVSAKMRARVTQPRWGCSPLAPFPRVARASQPWALIQNPVGIPGKAVTARGLLSLVQDQLWDREARFFKVMRHEKAATNHYGNTGE